MKYIFIILALLPFSAANATQTLGIGTSPEGTLTYRLGATYAAVLQKQLGIQARVQPNTGTTVMIPLVNSDELDVGFADSLELQDAYKGVGGFKGHPQKNLRIIARVFPIQVGFFVRKNSDIKTINDLKGKSIPTGYLSQHVLQKITKAILANGGLTLRNIKPVKVPNVIQGVNDFVSGDADAAFFAVGQAKVSDAASRVGGIRFLSMSNEPSAIKAMQKIAPTTKVVTVKPAKGLTGIQKPTKLMQYSYTIFVNKKTPKKEVERLTQALIKYKKSEEKSTHFFKGLSLNYMYDKNLSVPYAKGAISFYKNKGVSGK